MSDALVVQLQADIASFRQGMDAAVASLQKVQDSARRTSSSTANMQQSFASAAVAVKAFVAAKILEYMNELRASFVQLAEAPLKARAGIEALTKSSAQANDMLERTFEIASQTGVAFEDVAGITRRFTVALKDMGGGNAEVAQLTKTLIQMGTVGGGSVAEINAAMLQLSQALASGLLRGEELNSVLENMPLAAQAIAKEFGVSVGELRKMASEGKLTGKEVATALLKAAADTQAAFDKLPLTVERASNNIRTALAKAFDTPQIAGLVQAMAKGLQSWVPVIEKIGRGVSLFLADMSSLNQMITSASNGAVSFGKVLDVALRITGIGAVLELLSSYENLRQFLTQTLPAALTQLNAAWQAWMAAVVGVVGKGIDTLKGLWADFFNWVSQGMGKLTPGFTGPDGLFGKWTVDISAATARAKELADQAEETKRKAVEMGTQAAINASLLKVEWDGAAQGMQRATASADNLKIKLPEVAAATGGAKDKVKELNDELKRFAEQIINKIDPMVEFNATLGKIKAAFDAGYLSIEQYRAALKMLLEEQGKAKEETDKSTEAVAQFASQAGNMFFDAIQNGKDFGDVMKSLLLDLAKMIFQLTVMEPLIKMLRDGLKSSGGIGGILSGIFGSLFSAPVGGPVARFDNAIPLPGARLGSYGTGGAVNGGYGTLTADIKREPVNVVVNNYADATVNTRQRDNGDLEIIIEKVKRSITSDFSRGGNSVAHAVERAYGLNRSSVAA
jgi:tape measure domain-containing protein